MSQSTKVGRAPERLPAAPGVSIKRGNIIAIVGALSILGPFSVDTYFPSFPALAAHFKVPELQMQSTLTFYLVALAVMNLFHGAISDAFGRRRVILSALAVYTLTAAACLFAPTFEWLLALRVVQGLAAGAGMVVSRAVVRDLYDGVQAQKLMAQTAVAAGLGPVMAPIIGGWLHEWFGWVGPFLFLTALGLALWTACNSLLPESLPVNRRQSFHPGNLLRAYRQTLTHAQFVLLCLALGLSGGGFLLYVATAPDMVLHILKLKPTQFGFLFVPIVAGLILGSVLSGRLAGRMAPGLAVRYGFSIMASGAAVNLLVNRFVSQPPVIGMVLPLGVYTFGFALIAPVLTIQSLDLFPERRGLASSMQGFAHVIVFALISALAAPWVYNSGLHHAIGLAVLMIASWLAYRGSHLVAPERVERGPTPPEPTLFSPIPDEE